MSEDDDDFSFLGELFEALAEGGASFWLVVVVLAAVIGWAILQFYVLL